MLSKVLGLESIASQHPPIAGQASDHDLAGRTIANSSTAGLLARSRGTQDTRLLPNRCGTARLQIAKLPTHQNGVASTIRQHKEIAVHLRDRTSGQEPLPPHS
jgi:hypothetical protein